jgi:hypothetical protein
MPASRGALLIWVVLIAVLAAAGGGFAAVRLGPRPAPPAPSAPAR